MDHVLVMQAYEMVFWLYFKGEMRFGYALIDEEPGDKFQMVVMSYWQRFRTV